MNNAPFEMLIACIGAGGCWALWFYFIKEYRIAAFREELFSVRDELFGFAADGGISFESPAYTELRDLINGMVQFAHRVTLLTLLTSARSNAYKEENAQPYQHWKKSLETLEPTQKQRLEGIHDKLFSAYMKQLVEGSIILFPMATSLFALFYLRAQLKRLFMAQGIHGADIKTAMVRDLAQTLNARILETEAYREGKNSDKMELSLA